MRIQLIPDARVATLTQKSRKMAKMQKPVSALPIGRSKRRKKYSNKCGQCANKTLDVVRCDLHVSGGLEHVGEDVGHRWGSDGWDLGGWLGRGVGGRERFGDERQADAVLLGVDLHDGDGDFVAEFDDRFDALDAVFGEF